MSKKPGYVKLFEEGKLNKKVKRAYKLLNECTLCPRNCMVNRIKGEKGFCNTTAKLKISSCFPHFGEERPLVGKNGSGTIFISYCNLKCVFCQNYDISHYGGGEEITVNELSNIMLNIQNRGCHNINIVSPTHVVPQVIAALNLAARKGLDIPLVYNTGGYDSNNVIELLDGVVDIYLPDIKFGDDDTAEKYTGAKNYYQTVKKNLKMMYQQVGPLAVDNEGIAYKGVLVRHLVMPGDLSNSNKIFNEISKISKDIPINIMGQYFPAYRASEYIELDRRPGMMEIMKVKKWASEIGLLVLD
ncbi:radical SAM protein [Natranaerofaba carboxydovora]|uniref:radical SAM protein n=1 Tax=Natranaerofaba carboxydovora TaxID=2742683 RepID=UPI001F13A77A|nr:radical SAM protein [Natranaerofaba carboxydovora]UMZ74512.1 Radical SAM superfamily protein [Natranaerofaba carboxydovora]